MKPRFFLKLLFVLSALTTLAMLASCGSSDETTTVSKTVRNLVASCGSNPCL